MTIEKNHLLPFIYEGFVMDTDDPLQQGRLKVWIPALDGEYYSISNLPWAEYASPFGGVTRDFPAGRNKSANKGQVAYGFWAVPKLNAQVLCFFLNGEQSRRFWFASFFTLHKNRSLPAGRNTSLDDKIIGPLSDHEEPIQPAHDNLTSQFQGKLRDPLAVQLGSYERQVGQARTNKDATEGYNKSMADESYLDPQAYCWTTPGHHTILMNDHAEHCRIRIKSCEGNQVLMDDTNGRIYISTALGNTWIEINEIGDIAIYGGKNISMRAQQDVNITAGKNINMQAGNEMNVMSGSNTNISSGKNVNITSGGGSTILSACDNIDLTGNSSVRIKGNEQVGISGSSGVIVSGAKIQLNGAEAPSPSCATAATAPPIQPTHEPWTRPVYKKAK